MNHLIAFVFLAVFSESFCQQGINQLDIHGAKQGKWAVYLDKSWHEVSDSNKAIFVRYTHFVNGKNLYPMGPRRKNWRLESTGTDKVLNGEFRWYDGNGTLRAVDLFKDGHYVLHKLFYPNGKIRQLFDYSRTYRNQEHTYSITVYRKNGKPGKFFINRNGPHGWGLYEGSADDLTE